MLDKVRGNGIIILNCPFTLYILLFHHVVLSDKKRERETIQ